MSGRTPYRGSSGANRGRVPYRESGGQRTTRTPFRGGTTTDNPPAPQKKGGGGFFHTLARDTGAEFVGNLASDVGHTAVGVGPGLYKTGRAYFGQLTGKKPSAFKKEVADPVIANYKETYGHGATHFAKSFYKHPLGPLLDAATLLSGGASATAKVGKLAADAGAISKTSSLAKLGERTNLTTRSPRAIATGKGPRKVEISGTRPIVKGREVAAAKLRAKYPHGVAGVGGEVKKYGKQIQAEATQHALGHLNEYKPYLQATKGLSEKEQIALNIRSMDIHPDDLAQLWKGGPSEKLINDAKIRKLVLEPSKKMQAAEPHARQLSESGARLLRGKLNDETALARPGLTKKQASDMLGRPVKEIHGNPYYSPHVIDEMPKTVNPLNASGGGKAAPAKLGSMKENTGYLALSGKLHLRTDVLGPEFLKRVKYVKYDEVHNALIRGAVRISKQELDQHYGGKLPKGYEYLRKKRSDKIPATMRPETDTHTPLDKLIPNADDLHDSQLAKEGFSTQDPQVAHQSGGKFYIVPKATVRAATGEFTRSSDFVHHFIKKPLSVWRSAVLGLRVGFLTNNLVGNSVMYGVRTGGKGAIRDLFMAIKESHGDKVAKKALDSASTPPAIRQSLYQEFYPEQMHGTFGKTQSPSTSTLGQASTKVGQAWRNTTGAIPKVTSAVAETAYRKALIRHSIRHSPEFKKVYSSMPKATRSFEAAARQLHEGKGSAQYQRYISRQVNQALGDYLHMSPFERNVLRNAVPFYSWYRAITVTTAHLAADTPLRANILGQIGQIGKQWSDKQLKDVPTFLEGSIPIGHAKAGIQKVLGTQSLNPYATLEQLHRASTGDLSALGLNPFLQTALDTYARKTGRAGKIGPAQLAGEVLKQIVLGLPPARLAHPMKPSKLYPKRNRKSELFSYVGAPVKEYSVPVAAQQKKQGR